MGFPTLSLQTVGVLMGFPTLSLQTVGVVMGFPTLSLQTVGGSVSCLRTLWHLVRRSRDRTSILSIAVRLLFLLNHCRPIVSLTYSCRPPQTSAALQCSALTSDTSARVGGSAGDLLAQGHNDLTETREEDKLRPRTSEQEVGLHHSNCASDCVIRLGCSDSNRPKHLTTLY